MNDLPFITLIQSQQCSARDRWYPTSIVQYKLSIKLDNRAGNYDALKSNLAYSLQYLEFLEKEFAELNVSSVVYIMLVKTYVITGMSILEGLFSNIVKANGWWKTFDLESLGTVQANEKCFAGNDYVVKTEILRKVPPFTLQMNLDEFIKILSRHHQALQVDHLVYPALKRLKELRNRIHLQKNEDQYDHDYNAFDFRVKKEMGAILYCILTSPMVTNAPHTFNFLKCNVDDQNSTSN